MAGCDDVYYCVVDARGWLRDPAPLFHTNVEGTRNVLDVASRMSAVPAPVHLHQQLRHRPPSPRHDDQRGRHHLRREASPPYVRSRVQAEDLVLQYARETGLPAIAMCVSTTYGSGDWGRTPHGAIIAGAAFGKLPFVMSGIELEAVGVDDAARAMILAAERGRVGERYLISEKMISNAEVARIAAEAAGVAPPAKAIPLPMSYALATMGTLKARLRRTDERLSLDSLRLMRAEGPLDHGKAVRELGWQPRPVEESIREAARFWVGLRAAKKQAKAQSGTPVNSCRYDTSHRIAFATLLFVTGCSSGTTTTPRPRRASAAASSAASSATPPRRRSIADMKFSAPLTVPREPP